LQLRIHKLYRSIHTLRKDSKSYKSSNRNEIRKNNNICNICNINEWLGNKIVLELDHIDGNSKNDEISNLRMLCPNCHSQTPTFRGRGIKKIHKSDEEILNTFLKSNSIIECLNILKMRIDSNNYKRIYSILDKNNIKY